MPNTYSSTGFACIDGIYTATRQGGYPGGNDGVLFMCMTSQDYNAIRGYDSAGGTSTIHWFGTTWANGTLGNSTGAVNHDGHCGVTLGPWNGPVLIVNKAGCSVGINTGNTAPTTHNGRGLVVNGRGADTRGIIELWDPANGGKSVIQQVGGDTYIGQLARATGNGHLYFLTGGSGASATVSMMVTCAGLVGIGTGSPQSALHVCGPLTVSATGVGVHLGVDVGGYAGIQLSGAPAAGAYIDFSCSGADAPGRIIYYHASNSLDFTVCAASRMTIVCNGNVGIGTVDPGSRLTVTNCNSTTYCPQNTLVNGQWFRISNPNGTAGVGAGMMFEATGAPGGNGLATISGVSTDVGSLSLTFGTRNAGGNVIERMRLSSNGNLGIGNISPRYALDVTGGMMSNFYMSCCSTAIDGVGPYDYGIIGSGNGAGALLINDIVGARYTVHAGSYNLTFRKSVRNTIGACVYCTVMSFVGTTDTNCVPNVNIENSLGVGTASPSYRLHVNGTFYAAGSSVDYKQGISQYNTDSCMFMCLKPVTYQYKDEYTHLGKELKSETQIGLIAEDVAEVYPELAILVNEEDEKIVRNVDYEKLSIILLSELQKLRAEVDELKSK